MWSFEYFEPKSIQEAIKLLSQYSKSSRVLAGGVDLIPKMRKGILKPSLIINIQNIFDLNYIKLEKDKGLSFGAMARLYELERTKEIKDYYPSLFEAIHQIASMQVKHMGTAIGNLCIGTPASDVATALLVTDAEIRIVGNDGERREPIEKFFVDYHQTSLKPDQMVLGVFLPQPKPKTGSAFLNLKRTHADIAKLSVAVAITVDDGIFQEVKISIGSAAPTVIRAKRAESFLTGKDITSEVILNASEMASDEISPITDLRSTKDYRKNVTKILVKRAIDEALRRIKP